MKYTKIPLSIEEHVELLEKRGLLIEDKPRAERYLHNIGYFRLTGYMYHLQSRDGKHTFHQGISFDDVIAHYQFDKKLRALFINYLERIEIALRARLTDKFSVKHGFHWYCNPSLFEDKSIYEDMNKEIEEDYEDPQERFLRAFKNKYTDDLPPSNMALEILSLGKLARLYKALSNKDEKIAIAKDFNLPSNVLSSWVIYLTNVRNVCAHHGRLWNRKITADRPVIPTRKDYKFPDNLPEDFNTTMYGVTSLVERLLKAINPTNQFIPKLTTLIDKHPAIKVSAMGFPDNWKSKAPWVV